MPVCIDASDGRFVRFNAVSYQYAAIADDEWDSNWLVISLEAFDGRTRWSRRESALTTFEMAGLASWLRNWATGSSVNSLWDATEPCIAFQLEHAKSTNGFTLAVRLDAEFHRDKDREAFVGEPIELRFVFQAPHLIELANQVSETLERFPERALRT